MNELTGGCLCRSIRYQINSKALGSGQCFCRDCQFTSGGGPLSAFVVTRDSLVIEGEPKVFESTTHTGGRARRMFCPECGTPLFGDKDSAPGMVAVMAGSLDDPDIFEPQAISWFDAAPVWAYVDPELPRFGRDIGSSG